MKKMTKILLAAGGAALICGGAAMTYLKAQTPMTIQEELTLANLEAMALSIEDGENIGGAARWIVKIIDQYGSKTCNPGGADFCTF